MSRPLHLDIDPLPPPTVRALSDMERDDLSRIILEHGAKQLERQNVNAVYKRAFQIAAQILRGMKP